MGVALPVLQTVTYIFRTVAFSVAADRYLRFHTYIFHPCKFILTFAVLAFSRNRAISYFPFTYLRFQYLNFQRPHQFIQLTNCSETIVLHANCLDRIWELYASSIDRSCVEHTRFPGFGDEQSTHFSGVRLQHCSHTHPRYLGPRYLDRDTWDRDTWTAHTRRRHSWSTDPPFSRHHSSHRSVDQIIHCRQPCFSGCRCLHLELAPWIHRQCIYSTAISTSSENFPVPTFIPGHSSVVNIF